jgi:hypothetical protein
MNNQIITNAKEEQSCLIKKHTRIRRGIIKNNTAAVHWIVKTVRSEPLALVTGQIIKR